jgi:hypothetical protein
MPTTAFDEAWKSGLTPITGGWDQSFSKVRTKFRKYTNGGTNLWIGIASNGVDGCKTRWNSKYKPKGLNNMMPLYETSSDSLRKNMEKELADLVQYLDNVASGGGGGKGSPPYIVFAAWKED